MGYYKNFIEDVLYNTIKKMDIEEMFDRIASYTVFEDFIYDEYREDYKYERDGYIEIDEEEVYERIIENDENYEDITSLLIEEFAYQGVNDNSLDGLVEDALMYGKADIIYELVEYLKKEIL